jgi:hypothetical protein
MFTTYFSHKFTAGNFSWALHILACFLHICAYLCILVHICAYFRFAYVCIFSIYFHITVYSCIFHEYFGMSMDMFCIFNVYLLIFLHKNRIFVHKYHKSMCVLLACYLYIQCIFTNTLARCFHIYASYLHCCTLFAYLCRFFAYFMHIHTDSCISSAC